MPAPSLDEIAAMEDAELRKLLGLDQMLDSFKEEITKIQSLPAAARKEAEDRLQDRLTPRVDGSELRWIREDVTREMKRSGEEELADAEPDSIM